MQQFSTTFFSPANGQNSTFAVFRLTEFDCFFFEEDKLNQRVVRRRMWRYFYCLLELCHGFLSYFGQLQNYF